MHRSLVRATLTVAFAAALVPAARAQELGGPVDRWPQEVTRRPLTLDQGMVEITAPVGINLSKDADGKPVTLAPSVMFGVTNRWMIGIRHFNGLCFGGTSNGCAHAYEDVSGFTRLSFMRGGGWEVAVQGAVDVAPIKDPRIWAGEAGLALRAGGGALAVTAEPMVGFGLNDRTAASRFSPIAWNLATYDVITRTSTVGNKETIAVPVTVQLQIGPMLALAVGASLEGPLNPDVGSFSDFYRIPAGVAAVLTPVRWVDVGAALTFPAFGGKNDTRDARFLSAFLAFRI